MNNLSKFSELYLLEELFDFPGFFTKQAFGTLMCYLDGKLVIVLLDKKNKPFDSKWNGILIPVEKENHKDIQKIFPNAKPHLVLPKWLHIEQHEALDQDIEKLLKMIKSHHPKIGIIPKEKKKRKNS